MFAIAFNNCKDEISGENKEPYRDYFWEKILPPEMQTACKVKKGDFNTGQRKCTVEITYTNYYAPAVVNTITAKAGCNHNKTVKVPLNGKIFDCLPENFGVQRCYQEDPDAEKKNQNNMKALSSVVSASLGNISNSLNNATTAKKFDTSLDEAALATLKKQLAEDEKLTAKDRTNLLTQINEAEKNITNKRQEAAKANPPAEPRAVQEMAAASLGKQVFGKCELATGERVSEGETIKMEW